MTSPGPLACSALEAPVAVGTVVSVDAHATFYDTELVAGGAPWRLLRLSPSSSRVLREWVGGGTVRAGQEQFARTLVQQGLVHPIFPPTIPLTDLDVVIPVYRDAAALGRLLDQLLGFSVIVVDDGSENREEIAQVSRREGVLLVRAAHNEGPASARNRGLAVSTRPFVAFLDADVSVDDADEVLRALLAHFHDPLVAAVAPRVCGAGGTGSLAQFETRHGPLDMGPHSSLVAPRARVPYVPSAFVLTRRAALGDGFNEALRTGEDVDLVWRLHDRGWLVRYDASRVVHHATRPSLSAWLQQRYAYGRSAGALAREHPDRLEPVRVDAWTLAAWSALVAQRPRAAMAVLSLARKALQDRLPEHLEDPATVANAIAVRGIASAGGPLARSVVRTYGPLLLVAAVHPVLRKPALGVFALGTAWRWQHRPPLRPADVPLAVADDAAYAAGVWRGALATRSLRAVTPRITGSTAGLRSLLRLDATTPPPGA